MNCRVCGATRFGDVIDLGAMPLVNNLMRSPDEPCPRWPLKAVFCRECSLVQLTETPSPQAMFDEYVYFSSQSQTMVEHAGRLVDSFVTPGRRVFEIASNDGYLLAQAQQRGATVLGIEPARNIAEDANARGVPTRCDYFNRDTARTVREEWGAADVLFALNVLAHVPDPNEIAAGIAELLAEGGVAHLEVPYVLRMLDQRAFDTIYHEHQCYFSLSALRRLFHSHGLAIRNVSIIELHGGSLHLQVRRPLAPPRTPDGAEGPAVAALCAVERQRGLFDERAYADFAPGIEQLRRELLAAIDGFDHVVGYGAAAKAVVMLNFCDLGRARLPWVADVSPHKQGRFIPGTGQTIADPNWLLHERPQAAVLFPWNIRDEILRRNRPFLDQGGRFIVPIPEVEIVAA